MAFRNLFKHKKEKEKLQAKKEPVVEKPVDVKIEKKPAVEKVKPKQVRAVKIAPFILKKPQITEKASILAEKNDYVFKVADNASKPDIKKAIEEVYGVNVIKVRAINLPRKKKRLGRSQGWKSGYKKAIVKIKQGQSIEVLPK